MAERQGDEDVKSNDLEALREVERERDALRAEVERYKDSIVRLNQEQDALRAEVERLMGLIDDTESSSWWFWWPGWVCDLHADEASVQGVPEGGCAVCERDALRAKPALAEEWFGRIQTYAIRMGDDNLDGLTQEALAAIREEKP